MKSTDKILWAGKRNLNNMIGTYVFDSELQSINKNIVYLFDVKNDVVREFPRKGLRESFETIKDPDLQASTIKEYVKWLYFWGEDFSSKCQICTDVFTLKKHINELAEKYSVPSRHHGTQSNIICVDEEQEEENEIIFEEKSDYMNAWSSSSEDGWFYSEGDDD